MRGGAREGLNSDTLSVLRTEDNVIPSPLEIDIDIPSPCGIQERDAPTLSCLGPYALTVRLFQTSSRFLLFFYPKSCTKSNPSSHTVEI